MRCPLPAFHQIPSTRAGGRRGARRSSEGNSSRIHGRCRRPGRRHVRAALQLGREREGRQQASCSSRTMASSCCCAAERARPWLARRAGLAGRARPASARIQPSATCLCACGSRGSPPEGAPLEPCRRSSSCSCRRCRPRRSPQPWSTRAAAPTSKPGEVSAPPAWRERRRHAHRREQEKETEAGCGTWVWASGEKRYERELGL